MSDEARDRFLEDLCGRGLLSDGEVETARRLLAEAREAGRRVSLSEVLIRAGAEAAKARRAAAAFEGRRAGTDEAGAVEAAELVAPESSGLEVLGRIGRGSQAVVYRCRQVDLDRVVAVKILHPRTAGEAEVRERFLREARAAAVLAHPNIVMIHEIRPLGKTVAIVMEYVDGGTLADLLKVRKRFAPAEAVAIVRQVAEGLRAAHDRDLIHRDVNPRNIMLTRDGQVKLADMGLARHVAETDGVEGKAFGTPYYISPEQVTGDPPPDHRTDLYSLGVTLYEMVAGRPPFVADQPHEIMRMHVLADPPDPRDVVPDLPQPLCWLLAKAMAREPEDRYQSAGALIEALDRSQRDQDGLDLSEVGTRSGSVEPAEGPAALVHQVAPLAERQRRGGRSRGDRSGRVPARARGKGGRPASTGRRSGRTPSGRESQGPADDRPRTVRRKPMPAPVAGLLGLAAVAAAGGLVLLILYAGGFLFQGDPNGGRGPTTGDRGAGAPGPSRPEPEDADRMSRTERSAQAALASARRLENTPDAPPAEVLRAYRNVILFYPETRAAREAETAVGRLKAVEGVRDALPPAPGSEQPGAPTSARATRIEVRAAEGATIHGPAPQARYENVDGLDNIGNWRKRTTWVSWEAEVPRPGFYRVGVTYAAADRCAGNRYEVSVGPSSLTGEVESTGGWTAFVTTPLGTVEVPRAGPAQIAVRPLRIRTGPTRGALMNLKAVRLTEVK